eukprot:7678023-Ditylum_brightwellii.AAC.1
MSNENENENNQADICTFQPNYFQLERLIRIVEEQLLDSTGFIGLRVLKEWALKNDIYSDDRLVKQATKW